MDLPLISIVIPFYNESSRLGALVDHVNNLKVSGFSYEAIFVNNNSNDDFIQHFSGDSKIRLVNAPGKASSYYARNCGALEAHGKFLLFIDADVIPDESILLNYYKEICNLSKDSHTVFAGDIIPFHQESTHEDLGVFLAYAESRKILNQKSAATGWAFRPFAQTANCLMAMSDFASVGGFNDNMTSGGDSEICWRLAQSHHNFEVVYCQDAFVRHIHRADSTSFAKQFTKYGRGRSEQILESEYFSQNMKRQTHSIEPLALLLEKIIDLGKANNVDKEYLYLIIDYAKEMFFQTGYLRGLLSIAGIDSCLDYSILQQRLRDLQHLLASDLAVSNRAQ